MGVGQLRAVLLEADALVSAGEFRRRDFRAALLEAGMLALPLSAAWELHLASLLLLEEYLVALPPGAEADVARQAARLLAPHADGASSGCFPLGAAPHHAATRAAQPVSPLSLPAGTLRCRRPPLAGLRAAWLPLPAATPPAPSAHASCAQRVWPCRRC